MSLWAEHLERTDPNWRRQTRRFACACRLDGALGAAKFWKWINEAGATDQDCVVVALTYWAVTELMSRDELEDAWHDWGRISDQDGKL